jgi:hypothetical protein
MPTKTETLLSSLKINKLTRSQFLTAKAADEVDLDNEFYMTGEVLGEGDMLKEVYDKNGNGIVDNAEKVNGLTVLTAVPANAKFTDTTYSTFKGATSSAAGSVGLVPMPQTGATDRYLCGDGTWKIVTHPAVNNPTITITQNGVSKGSFTLNQIGNQTIKLQNTTYSVFVKSGTGAKSGLVPTPPATAGTTKFLREDAVWATPPTANNPSITISQNGTIKGKFTLNQADSETIALTDTTYSEFTGATTTAAGTSGLVPAPTSGQSTRYLCSDGTWSAPRGRVYGVKGNAETAYREGQVNITAANVGALPITGGTVSGATTFSDTVTLSTAGSITYDDGFYDG